MESNCVLVFCSRDICYSSGNFFASQLAEAFEELGYETEVCEFSGNGDIDAQLEPLLEREYRVIVDFNSMLPRMVMEDDRAYLDHLRGPFFDYIIDHPLFHYTGLTCGADNFHVLVVDESHRKYVKSYYSGVKTVYTLPLGAAEAFVPGRKEENYVLFMGTYDAPENVMDIVEASPKPMADTMHKLIERRIAEPKLPMEQAYLEILAHRGEELTPEQFALRMNSMYAVDAYVRDYFREKAIDALLAHKIPVVVAGEGWYKYHPASEQYLTREKAVTFGLSFCRIAKAPLLLNVTPFFPCGMHDRIAAGMANHTAVLTDENAYLNTRFTDGRELCFFDLKNLSVMCERAENLLEDGVLRRRIEEQGYETFLNGHTWKHRAKAILRFAEMENKGS